MGLLLDLAVAALALVVIGSLATLAWTLAVSATHATRHGRARVTAARRSVIDLEGRLKSTAAETSSTLSAMVERTKMDRYEPPPPGDSTRPITSPE
ncbi:MAG: hypothetical protein ACRDGD_02635 [Candidatus Limnocylindria bacterium]